MNPENLDQRILVDKVVQEASFGDKSLFNSLSEHEKQILIKLLENNDDELVTKCLWELDYERQPVDIQTFLTDPNYLGMDIIRNQSDEDRGAGVFEAWYDVLSELFNPSKNYWELILSCSIGSGKSAVSALALAYKIYRLSCLKDPQKFYGLLPGHSIVFGIYTVFKYKAKELAGDYLRQAIERCPYFRDVFPLDRSKTIDMEFPKSVAVNYGSSGLHAIGLNMYSVAIDETDFMRAGADENDKGQAYKLYTSTMRRMESRYMRGGEIPGIMIQISSKASAESYLADRIKNRRGTDNVLVVEKTSWDVKPWRYTGRWFEVFKGDAYSDPRIIEKSEELVDKSNVIKVPEEHRQAFEEDIHGSLRDLANVASVSNTPLISRKDRIHACIDANRKHPFTKQEFHIGLDDDTAIEDYINLEELLATKLGLLVPKVRPGTKRFMHIDLAVSGDAVGVAMGHVCGFDVVKKEDVQQPGVYHEFKAPKIYIDFVLRVVPKVGSKIRLSAIRDFIFALRGYGFSIAKISADTWQSTDMIQQLMRAGFVAEVLSVDVAKEKTGHPYAFLREAIIEERISYYKYDQLLSELTNLQRIDVISNMKIKWKVDHPVNKMIDIHGNIVRAAKDVSDSVAGVVYHCMTQSSDDDDVVVTPMAVIPKRGVSSSKNRLLSDREIIGDYKP